MTLATVRQCVVLVTGKAARRSGSAVPALADCGGRPALGWVLRECVRFGVERFLLLTGGVSGTVQASMAKLADGLPRNARATVAVTRLDAGSALMAAGLLLDERFLLCRGDVLFDCNLAALLALEPDCPRSGGILLQPPAGEAADATLGLFSRGVLDILRPGDTFPRDVLPRLTAKGPLRAVPTQGWFRDLTNADQLAAAREEAPRRLRRPALLLDRDGVLNVDHGWVGTRERFEWMPGALDAIRHATQAGWHVFVVTNQSGVARGLYDEDAVRALLAWMAEQAHAAGGTIDDARYCPYHEDAAVDRYRRAHPWRKPEPGMLLDLIRAWELDPARCLMIGDQPSDMQAAAAAGVRGHLFPGGNLLEFVRPLLAAA